MLRIAVTYRNQTQQHRHAAGPLEFGRWPRQGAKRIRLKDFAVSRDQLRIEELPSQRLLVENLSQRWPITLGDNDTLSPGSRQECALPVRLATGQTVIAVEAGDREDSEPLDAQSLHTIATPIRQIADVPGQRSLLSLGESPAPQQLAHWLETVLLLQRTAAGSTEFYEETAHALVDLIGLNLGLVVLRQDAGWSIAAQHRADENLPVRFSRTLVGHVAAERRTFFQDLRPWSATASLAGVEAAVVSPIFGVQDEVVGVLYGVRTAPRLGGIQPLEAQVVQLLAAAASANLARFVATRTRVQFEQFFSPELVRELEHNPALLEGRSQEVTVLASDLRGFTSLSERLGAQTACRVIGEVMDALSERIFEQEGVIVDYAGDGILAMWNAPVPQPDHAVRACRAALAMLDELPSVEARWREVTATPLALGIGINTGLAQVGNTGSKRKLKYGPFGHTVNLASRVQGATKALGASLLITASTQAQLTHAFLTRSAGQIDLAGVSASVTLFEVQREDNSFA